MVANEHVAVEWLTNEMQQVDDLVQHASSVLASLSDYGNTYVLFVTSVKNLIKFVTAFCFSHNATFFV